MRMAGVSACVPEQVVATEDIPLMTPEEAEVFNNTVGIRRRHIAPESVCASDMCQKAADALLEELGWERDSIDVLIFESVTGDYRTPPTSCILQDRMGLPDTTFCLDMPMGCCGCLYAITVGSNLLTTGNVRRALLLIGDTALRMGSIKDKSRVPLFGDCGTAIALEYDPEAPEIVVDFHTLGKGYKALMTPHGGFRNPAVRNRLWRRISATVSSALPITRLSTVWMSFRLPFHVRPSRWRSLWRPRKSTRIRMWIIS